VASVISSIVSGEKAGTPVSFFQLGIAVSFPREHDATRGVSGTSDTFPRSLERFVSEHFTGKAADNAVTQRTP
jgi:hypothetical protein